MYLVSACMVFFCDALCDMSRLLVVQGHQAPKCYEQDIMMAAGTYLTTKRVGTASKRVKNSKTDVWMVIFSL